MTADELVTLYPAGTILTIEGRFPEPVRLEASPSITGGYVSLKAVSITPPNTYRSVLIPFPEFTSKVQVIARPGQRSFAANAAHFRLAVEAERLRLAYAYDPHFAVSISLIDPLPHQIDAVYHHMLKMPRVRFLLADDPGAGKTIMAGLLLKELKFRKVARRVLVITPAALTSQWEGEMQSKFGEHFRLVSRGTVSDNPGRNIWQEFDQVITSIDFAKQEPMLAALEEAEWDLVIVDEAHKMSAYKSGQDRKASNRYKLGLVLSKQANNILLLTATPHRGDPDNFIYLLQLVDPDLFQAGHGQGTDGVEERSDLSPTRLAERARAVLLRRLKEDLKDFDGKPLYPPRTVETLSYDLSREEQALYEAVTEYVGNGLFAATRVNDRNTGFALITLQRRVASSLMAIHRSLDRRRARLIEVLQHFTPAPAAPPSPPAGQPPAFDDAAAAFDEAFEDEPERERWDQEERLDGATTARNRLELEREIITLEQLIGLAQSAERAGSEAKLNVLRAILENPERRVIGGSEKLLIFTEAKDTLDYLEQKLRAMGLDVTTIHGLMKMEDRRAAEKAFREHCQVLIATEAAGEGINLQFCRLLINYDIPWNPNRLEQRMGRIHRYLQKRPVYIYNLVAGKTREGEVVKRLLDKLETMRTDLGTDKVFDVVSGLLEGMHLDLEQLIVTAIANDAQKLKALDVIDTAFKTQAHQKLQEASEELLADRYVNLEYLSDEKERSRLARIVPEASERFFVEACRALSMKLERRADGLWRIPTVPAALRAFAAGQRLSAPQEAYARLTFFKSERTDEETVLLSPTHPLFDAVVEQVRARFSPLLAEGTVFHEPGGPEAGALWFYLGKISDGNNVAVGEKLFAVRTPLSLAEAGGVLVEGSFNPAALVNLKIPDAPAPVPDTAPLLLSLEDAALQSVIAEQLQPYFSSLDEQRTRNVTVMQRYIEKNLSSVISQDNKKLMEQQRRLREGEDMALAISITRGHLDRLIEQKKRRLAELTRESSLTMGLPELLGIALCQPIAVPQHLEDALHSDPEVERAAVAFVLAYEREQGRDAVSYEKDNVGYDLESQWLEPGEKPVRYIEVKGRAQEGRVSLTPNEWDTARRLTVNYWLYVVTDAKTAPKLRAVQDPANNLAAVEEVTVTRYLVPVEEYKRAAIEEKL